MFYNNNIGEFLPVEESVYGKVKTSSRGVSVLVDRNFKIFYYNGLAMSTRTLWNALFTDRRPLSAAFNDTYYLEVYLLYLHNSYTAVINYLPQTTKLGVSTVLQAQALAKKSKFKVRELISSGKLNDIFFKTSLSVAQLYNLSRLKVRPTVLTNATNVLAKSWGVGKVNNTSNTPKPTIKSLAILTDTSAVHLEKRSLTARIPQYAVNSLYYRVFEIGEANYSLITGATDAATMLSVANEASEYSQYLGVYKKLR